MNIETFDYDVDLLATMLWEYDEALILKSLITQKQAWYTANQTVFFENFETYIFSVLSIDNTQLDTLQALGYPIAFALMVWSIILNIPLQKGQPSPPPNTPIFGFDWRNPAWTENLNYYYANFSNGGTQPILTLDQQQLLLRLRYFDLTTRGDIPDINKFVQYAFTGVTGFSGKVYALDTYLMIISYIFTGSLSRTLQFILEEYDILPRPAGVGVHIFSNIDMIWGFGPYYQNFSHGSYIED